MDETYNDLRTRIAKVLYRNFGGPFWDDETDEAREMWCCDADRLIRELNLATACQSGCVWQIPNHIENMTDAQKQLLKIAEPPSWGTPSFDNGSRDD